MSIILTQFVHRGCALTNAAGCNTYQGVEFGVKVGDDVWITSTVVNAITAAARNHVMIAHRAKDVEVKLLGAYFVWKDAGNSSNLLAMDSDTARKQIRLAINRGCIDRLHVEFLARIVTPSTAPTQDPSKNSFRGEGQA